MYIVWLVSYKILPGGVKGEYRCMPKAHVCVSAPAKVSMKLWAYLRTRIVVSPLSLLCYCTIYPIIAIEVIMTSYNLRRGTLRGDPSAPPPLPLYDTLTSTYEAEKEEHPFSSF